MAIERLSRGACQASLLESTCTSNATRAEDILSLLTGDLDGTDAATQNILNLQCPLGRIQKSLLEGGMGAGYPCSGRA